MLLISDTNILGSLAAGDAIDLLFRLFPKTMISIPPAVHQELEVGLDRGQTHLAQVLQAITANQIQVFELSVKEQETIQTFPNKLNLGECEAIALAQHRDAPLLSNDKRAIGYCQREGIEVVDLADLLRALWTRRIISQAEVRQLIEEMKRVEKLTLNKTDRAKIFAPHHARRRRRRRKS